LEVTEHIRAVASVEAQIDAAIERGAPLSEIRTLIAGKRAPVSAKS
jgi:hypothetical protein